MVPIKRVFIPNICHGFSKLCDIDRLKIQCVWSWFSIASALATVYFSNFLNL
jgi:hypothetical protein